MRNMVYKSISVVLMIAVGMMIMAAHHEKESDDLASLKEAFNLSRESWRTADLEAHFSTVHPAGSRITANGRIGVVQDGIQNVEQIRGWITRMNENREFQIADLNFNIQGSTAVVTYNQTSTGKRNGREWRTAVSQIWTHTDGKWLRLHQHASHITNDLVDMTNRFIEEVFNKGNLSVADELCAPDVVHTEPLSTGAVTNGIEEFKQFVVGVRTAFPDAKLTIDRGMIARANKVTAQWTFSGTHQGEFMGVAATGKKVTNKGISILTFAKGKIVADDAMWDPLNLWRQLGVDPPQPLATDSSTTE